MKKRNLTSDLQKLARAFYLNLNLRQGGEGWAIGLDDKRPFGNSNVLGDILEIIGWAPEFANGEGYTSEQEEYALMLFEVKLVPYLRRQFELHLPKKKGTRK